MKVMAALIQHPKYRMLKKRLGPDTLEYLIAMWGHCEIGRKGEEWFGANEEYLEMVCGWTGEPGVLLQSMAEVGFVEVHEETDEKERSLVIHDWEYYNSHTVSAWKNGKKGGKIKRQNTPPSTEKQAEITQTKPNSAPSVTDGIPNSARTQPELSPTGNPLAPVVVSESESGSGCCTPPEKKGKVPFRIPGQDEVLEAARKFEGDLQLGIPGVIPEGWALSWYSWRLERRNKFPRDWMGDMRRRFVADYKSGRPNTLAGQRQVWRSLVDHPGNPDSAYFAPCNYEARREFEKLRKEGGGV